MNKKIFKMKYDILHSGGERGITLTALIITIIIILIIASIAFKLIINERIIVNGKESAEKYNNEKIVERIKLVYNEYKISKVENPQITLNDKLKETFGEDNITNLRKKL